MLAPLIFGYNYERWNSFAVTTEFPAFHELSRHPLHNNYTAVSLENLRPNPSSQSVKPTDWEIYKPNHDLRELNILHRKPPHAGSSCLDCQLHCGRIRSFCVCRRDTRRDFKCGFKYVTVFHEHAFPASYFFVCLYLTHNSLIYTKHLVISLRLLAWGLAGLHQI